MNLPVGFDLHTLEVFVLTARLGGMTQSAELLGRTQSAVSQTISKLETALGVTLFDRSLRPLVLTHEGKMLFEHGTRLLDEASELVTGVRESQHLPLQALTIAMAESMANQLTAPFLTQLGKRAKHWRVKSIASLNQLQDFTQRRFDMLITGSSTLEDAPGFQHFPILQEPFILVLPGDYKGKIDPIENLERLPFIRESLDSGMGRRIERQIGRLRLRLDNFVEIDSTHQQITSVAAGLGWSITSPLCLVPHLSLLDHLRLEPMPRAQFTRRFQLVAREKELGDLPEEMAVLGRQILREVTFTGLIARFPWIEQTLEWPT